MDAREELIALRRLAELEAKAAQGPAFTGPTVEATDSLGNKVMRNVRGKVADLGTSAEVVTEGAMRLLEGTGELASAVGQAPFAAYDHLRSPRMSELVTGKQPSVDILGNYNEAVEGGRADRSARFERTYGKEYPEGWVKAAELGMGMLTGATEVKAVKTLWGAIKAGATVGAASSAMSYTGSKEVSEKIQSTLVGSAIGAGVGAVPGAVGATKNAIGRYLTGDPVPDAAQKAAQVQSAFPSLRGELTIGQQTGNVRTLQTEAKVAQRLAQEQWLSQQTKLVKELDDLAKKYGPDMPPEEVVKRGGQAIANASFKLTKTRNAIWNSDLDAIKTKLQADAVAAGRKPSEAELVALPGLQDRVGRVLEQFNVGPEALSPRVRKILEDHGAAGESLKFDDLDYLLRSLNDNNFSVLQGTGNARAEAVAAKRLRQAVSESLDEIAESSEVGALLQQARSTYRQQSMAIKEINTSAAAKALGVDKNGYTKLVEDPEAAMQKILELTPSQQRQAMGILRTSDPDLVATLRGENLRSALRDATRVTSAGTPTLDIQRLLNATVGGGKLRAAGLYSPADGDILKSNLEALTTLMNRAGYKAPVTEATEAGMSAVGMAAGNGSLPFVTRIVGKIMGGFGAEKVLFDPKARQEFLTIANSFGTKSAKAAAAAGRLEAMLEESYNTPEQR